MAIVHNRILKTARLPFEVTRGSLKVRDKKASLMCHKFYMEIDKIQDKQVKIEDFKKIINGILAPNKINIAVEKNKYGYAGSFSPILEIIERSADDIELRHHGYEFNFRLNEQNDSIKVQKCTIVHEVRHFFDHLFKPDRSVLRVNTNNLDKWSISLRNNLIEKMMEDTDKAKNLSLLKKEVNEALKQMPQEMQIDYLQTIRKKLSNEINAYNEEIKFLSTGFGFLKNFDRILHTYKFLHNTCKFNSKLKFVTAKLKEVLIQARKINADSIKSRENSAN